MDRLDAMRIFVTVARLESFVEAARQLRLSPSVVTRAIAQLEDRLGLVLLNRTTRSVRLTEQGEIYRESCRQILDDVEDAERRVRGEAAAPRGELTISAPIVFGRLHVLPIITRLLREERALAVRLSLSDRNVHLVEEGVDVAVRIGEPADSALVGVRLGEVSRIVVAAPAYLRTRGVPDRPTALAGHDIIRFDGAAATNEWRFSDGYSARVEPRLTVSSADAAILAAEAGLGITQTLSYQARASVTAGRLVPILQGFALPPVAVNALYPAKRIASANVAAFVKAARDHFRADPLLPVEAWVISASA
ncbi:MAG TPA: LysR family transcriptional regulator [Stellaceae bacterium]|nr:LysR family transcriptional regulator [Stellaceae bacterium]